MNIISFATAESDWKVPRLGIILSHGGRDTGYRLDCERLFDTADHPSNPLSWFDLDGPWLQKAREIFDNIERDANELEHAKDQGWLVPSSDAYWFAPVPRPGKLICIGLNYRDHAKEANLPVPEKPILFSKFSSAVIAPGEPVMIPTTSQKVDYEAELAVVIGRRARHVSADRAYDYVLGYTAFNDITARDFQFADGQWQRGKSCDTFAPMGQTIVTTDTIPDPQKLSIKLTLNGEIMQDSNTDQMIFGVPRLIEFISESITLEPGDVIATGTPAGVGFARKPPVFLKPGDQMEIYIEGMGGLGNPVVEEQEN
ncbi:MAG TPA: fumarylacetoacetate hydrolase family protein [Pyrinomonadaceae bacterium]|nr:fumarylacetoacetate hydrolase family protein [Pyrinomonadaceae bacterium]